MTTEREATPRTDAYFETHNSHQLYPFCIELERELNAATAELARLQEELAVEKESRQLEELRSESAEAKVKELTEQLAVSERDRQRLISSNEHWHIRIQQTTTELSAERDCRENLDEKLGAMEANLSRQEDLEKQLAKARQDAERFQFEHEHPKEMCAVEIKALSGSVKTLDWWRTEIDNAIRALTNDAK